LSGQAGGGHEPSIPDVGADGLRHWQVAGGVITDPRGMLLVENLRRNGQTDWSTPGGVVDPGETPTEGLTREVEEETGLTVTGWSGPLYRVEVTAPDAGFFLRVEAHLAKAYTGSLRIDDPDGIVVSAEFVDQLTARSRLQGTSPWVVEPLLAHLEDGVADGRVFRYLVEGDRSDRRITRSHDR
jgi:8-oxo-dGTP diphosphatase